jgi:murein DD-endopeptidase MepM/ murein hydrolase activator NlpD
MSTIPAEAGLVKIFTSRVGEETHFWIRNEEYSEITLTIEMSGTNLKGNVSFPFTGTFAPHQTAEAFVLSPAAPGEKWTFDYTNYYKLGSQTARHDDSYLYQLPYTPGEKHKVTQGYNGPYSHTGSNQYATDWKMPEGTLVRAARGGVVVRVKDDSDKGGSSRAYDRYNNYVLIRHDDGTLGHYCHLQKGGCMVTPGQKVVCGDPIAHSGNTGFSSGAHLHFCVFKTLNGRERLSIPVKFRTATEEGVTLMEGATYKAAPLQPDAGRDVAAARPLSEAVVR